MAISLVLNILNLKLHVPVVHFYGMSGTFCVLLVIAEWGPQMVVICDEHFMVPPAQEHNRNSMMSLTQLHLFNSQNWPLFSNYCFPIFGY